VPSQQRRGNLVACVHMLRDAVTAPAVVWLKVLGLMASIVDLVPLCRFHMRHTDSPSSSLQTAHRPVVQIGSQDGHYQGRAELVGQPNQPVSGAGVSHSTLHVRCDDGRVQDRLGSPFEGSSSFRRMDAFRNKITHKSFETLGSHKDSQGVREGFDQLTCSSAIRQLDRGIIHQPGGRYPVTHSVSLHSSAVAVVSNTRDSVEDDTHSQENVHHGD
jgi:hypothetical protein